MKNLFRRIQASVRPPSGLRQADASPQVHGLVEGDAKHEDVVRMTNGSELHFQLNWIAAESND